MEEKTNHAKQFLWLIKLRWLSTLGGLTFIIIADRVLYLSIPSLSLWILVAVSALSNIALQFYVRNRLPTSQKILGTTLVFDTAILTIFLSLTGGADNPFSIVYLLYVAIAALLLGTKGTWAMVVITTISFISLFILPTLPITQTMGGHCSLGSFSSHLYGMLIAFSLVAILTGYFLSKMSQALQDRERELGDLRVLAEHQDRLVSLTTLAGGAAHELATPLSTIHLTASELKKNITTNSPEETNCDLELIVNQTKRCKSILENMALQAGETVGEMSIEISAQQLAEQLNELLGDDVMKHVELIMQCLRFKAPPKALAQSLATLVRNAFDASPLGASITLSMEKQKDAIAFIVSDFGHGISPDLLPRIGEPFFTTKEPGKGMGLGIYLVKLFAFRLRGSCAIESIVGKGTTVTLTLPQES